MPFTRYGIDTACDLMVMPRSPLDRHRVEHLVAKLPVGHHVRALNEPVRQRRFAVVDMGDDAEVARRLIHGDLTDVRTLPGWVGPVPEC